MSVKKARLNAAMINKAVRLLARPAAGAAVGGGLGYYVTPELFGYADVPEARRISALSDAATGALLGGYANRIGGFRAGARLLNKLPISKQLTYGGAVVGVPEIGPQLMATAKRNQSSAIAQLEASRNVADAAQSVSIPGAIQRALNSGTVRGAATGAAGAGLAAIVSGLMRRRSRGETAADSSRPEMMQKDFLKYLLPALVAGGVVGSMRRGTPASPGEK